MCSTDLKMLSYRHNTTAADIVMGLRDVNGAVHHCAVGIVCQAAALCSFEALQQVTCGTRESCKHAPSHVPMSYRDSRQCKAVTAQHDSVEGTGGRLAGVEVGPAMCPAATVSVTFYAGARIPLAQHSCYIAYFAFLI
jgi:hypothetical protein